MRSPRAKQHLVPVLIVTLLVLAGCARSGDVTAGSNPAAPAAIVDGSTEEATTDGADLRTPGDPAQDTPGTTETTVAGSYSPPTLSEAGAATSVTVPPNLVSPEQSSAPTTVAGDPTPTGADQAPTTVVPTESVPPVEPMPDGSTANQPDGSETPSPDDLAAGEARSAELLNQLRGELGLTALVRDPEMDAFARDWSKQMAETGAFQHSTGPHGENIAFTSNTRLTAAEAAELFHQLWVDSPGHYANMTNGGYVKAGVGVYRTDRGWYGTHVFNF